MKFPIFSLLYVSLCTFYIPEFKALLDELNLKVAAVHGIGGAEDMEFAKALGVSYLSTDIHPKTRTREEILGFCEDLNNLKKNAGSMA